MVRGSDCGPAGPSSLHGAEQNRTGTAGDLYRRVSTSLDDTQPDKNPNVANPNARSVRSKRCSACAWHSIVMFMIQINGVQLC